MEIDNTFFEPTLRTPEDIFSINEEQLKQDIVEIKNNFEAMLMFSLLHSLEKHNSLISIGIEFPLNHLDGSIVLNENLQVAIHPEAIAKELKRIEKNDFLSETTITYHLEKNFISHFNETYDLKNNWIKNLNLYFDDVAALLPNHKEKNSNVLSLNIHVKDINKYTKIDEKGFSNLFLKLKNIKHQHDIINECLYIGSEIILSSHFEVDYKKRNCFVAKEEFDFPELMDIPPFLHKAINLYIDNFSHTKNISFTNSNKKTFYEKELNLSFKTHSLDILKDKYIIELSFKENNNRLQQKIKRI